MPIKSASPQGKTAGLYFETERLLVRRYTPEDLDELFQVMSDPRVHTFTKDRNNPWDRQRTEKYLQYMIDRDFQTLDCFHGAVIGKQTGRLMGFCGLNPYREKEPEIEFKIGTPYWGRGCATELGKGLLRAAFAATNIKGVYGMAQPENVASRRVLEKIGMGYLGRRTFRDHEACFYYIAGGKLSPDPRQV